MAKEETQRSHGQRKQQVEEYAVEDRERYQQSERGERIANVNANATSQINELARALFPALEELPRVPQQARSREKRSDILQAAASMFVERGYAGTTSDDIAALAGVSVGTFYNYFRNKRQVLVALVLERLEDIFSNLQLTQMDFSRGDQRETIRRAIAAVMGGTQNGLRRVWLELMSHNPDLVPYQELIRRHVLTQLEQNVRRAVSDRGAWPDLDIEATTLAIFTLLDTMSLRLDTQVDDERQINALTDIVYRSLFPTPGHTSAPPTQHSEEVSS